MKNKKVDELRDLISKKRKEINILEEEKFMLKLDFIKENVQNVKTFIALSSLGILNAGAGVYCLGVTNNRMFIIEDNGYFGDSKTIYILSNKNFYLIKVGDIDENFDFLLNYIDNLDLSDKEMKIDLNNIWHINLIKYFYAIFENYCTELLCKN